MIYWVALGGENTERIILNWSVTPPSNNLLKAQYVRDFAYPPHKHFTWTFYLSSQPLKAFFYIFNFTNLMPNGPHFIHLHMFSLEHIINKTWASWEFLKRDFITVFVRGTDLWYDRWVLCVSDSIKLGHLRTSVWSFTSDVFLSFLVMEGGWALIILGGCFVPARVLWTDGLFHIKHGICFSCWMISGPGRPSKEGLL